MNIFDNINNYDNIMSIELLATVAEFNQITGVFKTYLQYSPNKGFINVTINGPVDNYGQHNGSCIIYSGRISIIMHFNGGSACFDKPVLVKRIGEMYRGYINNNFSYHGSGLLTFLGLAKTKTIHSIFSINGHFINDSIDYTKEVEMHYLNGDVYIGYVDVLFNRDGKGVFIYQDTSSGNILSIEGCFKHNIIVKHNIIL